MADERLPGESQRLFDRDLQAGRWAATEVSSFTALIIERGEI